MTNFSSEETEDERIIHNKDSLYFEKRHIKEECPIVISKEKQKYYQLLEDYYETICPKATFNESISTSRKEREKLGIEDDDNYIHGEIPFRTLAYIFEVIRKEFGDYSIMKGNFVDLGSGSGNGCLAAALIHPFNKCIGYEILEELHSIAEINKQKYNSIFPNLLNSSQNKLRSLFPIHLIKPDIVFHKENFLKEDWYNNASFVLTNSTCFDLNTWERIVYESQKLKKGSFFVNTTKSLPKEYRKNWVSLPPFKRLMSWGVSTVFIHLKKI